MAAREREDVGPAAGVRGGREPGLTRGELLVDGGLWERFFFFRNVLVSFFYFIKFCLDLPCRQMLEAPRTGLKKKVFSRRLRKGEKKTRKIAPLSGVHPAGSSALRHSACAASLCAARSTSRSSATSQRVSVSSSKPFLLPADKPGSCDASSEAKARGATSSTLLRSFSSSSEGGDEAGTGGASAAADVEDRNQRGILQKEGEEERKRERSKRKGRQSVFFNLVLSLQERK